MHNEKEIRKSLREPLNIIFKHKAKILTVFLTVVVITTIGSFLMPPIYEASSKILVKFGRENIFMPTNRVEGRNPPIYFDSSRQERLNSEMEILKGRTLVETVISNLGAKNIYPHIDKEPIISLPSSKDLSTLEKATIAFEKNLTVEGVKKSDIISIRFQHGDPQIASQALNELLDAFFEHHLSAYKQSQQYNFFGDQVALLEKELKDSENELEIFRNKNNIFSLQEQKTLLLKQISDLEIKLTDTLTEISKNEGMMQSLKDHSSAASMEIKLGEETDINPYTISGIKNSLYELKLREKKLLGKYTEQNVLVVSLRKEIEDAQALLAKEEKIYHDKVVISISNTLSALRNQENTQRQYLASYQDALSKINSTEQKLKELERRVKLNEENYQLYSRNMEEARISNAMDNQKLANISVVEPPFPPMKPVKPKKLLNIILSIILGGVAGLGMAFFSEYFSHTFNKGEDIKKHLGFPVLASIPKMK